MREEDTTDYPGCYSEDFLMPGESLITLQRVLESYGIRFEEITRDRSTHDAVLFIVEFIRNAIHLDTLEYFSIMLPLDALLLNEDRHLNNIAFIHGDSGYRLCPLFDHGLSLLSDTKDYPLTMPVDVAIRTVKAKPFSKDFSKQARALDTTLQINRSSVLQFIEQNDKQLGRVSKILRSQIVKYEYLFV
ncbi:HipA domain-containing protein [Paenibacillus rhizoplanae]